jgi:predicted RNA-binding Zn-ribbon protein involved in translation (DUF1610 family)
MTQRKITPKTKAEQYMCPECGKIFEDKKSFDTTFTESMNPAQKVH